MKRRGEYLLMNIHAKVYGFFLICYDQDKHLRVFVQIIRECDFNEQNPFFWITNFCWILITEIPMEIRNERGNFAALSLDVRHFVYIKTEITTIILLISDSALMMKYQRFLFD